MCMWVKDSYIVHTLINNDRLLKLLSLFQSTFVLKDSTSVVFATKYILY